MSGLFALLDDVAGIAKIAAASVDDVAGQAAKAGAKAAGAVIDDAAVTPKYVHGFAAERELPIVGKIAMGSIRNKILILLPMALLLSALAPWAITPLLMVGGIYLSYEGAEKIAHAAFGHAEAHETAPASGDLETQKVSGAVKTDFILSAEIMTIALASLPQGKPMWMEAIVLALVGIGITVVVYGGVAVIVKTDDVGMWMARGRFPAAVRAFGAFVVRVMPAFLRWLMIIGTAAMLWVGGSIIVHGASELSFSAPYEAVHHLSEVASEMAPRSAAPLTSWIVTAACDGLIGVMIGFVAIGVVSLVRRLSRNFLR